jgi:hypothetical protein
MDDMEPFVFKASLHFIYTDLLTLGLGVEMTCKDKLASKEFACAAADWCGICKG